MPEWKKTYIFLFFTFSQQKQYQFYKYRRHDTVFKGVTQAIKKCKFFWTHHVLFFTVRLMQSALHFSHWQPLQCRSACFSWSGRFITASQVLHRRFTSEAPLKRVLQRRFNFEAPLKRVLQRRFILKHIWSGCFISASQVLQWRFRSLWIFNRTFILKHWWSGCFKGASFWSTTEAGASSVLHRCFNGASETCKNVWISSTFILKHWWSGCFNSASKALIILWRFTAASGT